MLYFASKLWIPHPDCGVVLDCNQVKSVRIKCNHAHGGLVKVSSVEILGCFQFTIMLFVWMASTIIITIFANTPDFHITFLVTARQYLMVGWWRLKADVPTPAMVQCKFA